MRLLRLLFLPLLTMSIAPAVSARQAQTKPGEASKDNAVVAGTVVRLDTGEPLKKARVGLQSRKNDDYDFQLTDEQGHFLFENVPAGSYDLNVSRNGFVDAEYGQKKPGATGAILTIEAGQHLTDLIFKLARAAAISGHVYDEDGEPVARAQVIAYRASKRTGKEQEEGDLSISTNDLGEFRIFGLAPGRYYLAANYRIQDYHGLASKEAQERFNPGYLPTYYPSTGDSARAVAISVGPGEDIRTADITLRTAHLVTVSGKVVSAINGVECGGFAVELEHRGSGLADAVQSFSDFENKKGEFSIQDVPPGSYDLVAFCVDLQTHAARPVSRPLDVGESDIQNLLITASRGTDISGRVTWEGRAPQDEGGAFLNLRSLEDQRLFKEAQIKADGAFQFKDLPENNYRVLLTDREREENYYLKSVRYGSAAVGSAGFTVQSGSDATLDVVISSRAARLSGAVLNTDSLPAVGVEVVLVPEPPNRQVKSLYVSATTDQNGKFSITGITPGDYKVFSWNSVEESDEVYGEDWYDTEWLKQYESKGDAVHFDEGDQKAVNVTVIDTSSDSPAAN